MEWLIEPWIDWLSHWKIGWLIDSLVGCLTDWTIDWLIDWLTDWLVGWSVGWLVGWLVDWLMDWLLHWLIDWLIDWLSEWLIGWLIESDWVIDWVWLIDGLIEWMILQTLTEGSVDCFTEHWWTIGWLLHRGLMNDVLRQILAKCRIMGLFPKLLRLLNFTSLKTWTPNQNLHGPNPKPSSPKP